MANKVMLNNVQHQDLRVAALHGPEFGDAVNQMLVFPTEFEMLQREYVILFRKDAEGAFQAIVLLGLDKDENLFLDERRWNAGYVPAIQQRGPFSIHIQQGEDGASEAEPMIHVDLDDPRVGRADGFPLFLPHGGNAPYLEHIAAVLRTIHLGVDVAKPMFAAFQELGLIEPLRLEVNVSEEKKYVLPDFHALAAERFARLDGDALERLHRQGFLVLAVFALASLGNMGKLIDLKNSRPERL